MALKELELNDLKEIIEKFDESMLEKKLADTKISNEDKQFYVDLFTFVLQRKQKKVIEQGIF